MDSQDKGRQRGGEIGRMAAKLVKNAGPRTRRLIEEGRPKVEKAIEDARPKVEKAIEDARPKVQKAVEDYRPHVEKAGRDAARYAEEHQDEIKGLALKGVRMRLGPLGFVLDALGVGGQQAPAATASVSCDRCGAAHTAGSRFCSECGAPLAATDVGSPGGKA